jgi:hypothetical protein
MNLFPIPETSASVCAGAEARGERTMLTTELLDMLIRHAKEYRVDRLSSLARNTHMHDVTLEALADGQVVSRGRDELQAKLGKDERKCQRPTNPPATT